MNITKKIIEHYDTYGYVIFDNVFTKKDLNLCKYNISNILNWRLSHYEDKKPYIDRKNILKEGLTKLAFYNRKEINYVKDSISGSIHFKSLISKKNIQVIANALMKKDRQNSLFGFINQCRINLPDDNLGELGWHREIFQTIPRSEFIQIWAPIIYDSEKKNGTLQIIPGSHLVKIKKPPWKSNKNNISKIEFKENSLVKLRKKDIKLKLGQAIFFNGNLLHRSGKNISNTPRYSIVGLYHNIFENNFLPPKESFSYRKESPEEFYKTLPDII